ncbi:hypothetical protein ACH4UM_37580 [Streptomyces sp. NPDC020801]|uniref:hypothetical protein n=1 Tax=unclassified Streptomyces TaxID=2593676 RepID=UPI0037A64671
MARERFKPAFDPDCGDEPLTSIRPDIVIGRWQGLRDLLRATGTDWLSRGHRIRLLAQACANTSTVESWLAAEPRNADALVLRAATETARAFNVAITTGRGIPIDHNRIDAAFAACRHAATAYPEDPTPWISLICVARLYTGGVRSQELERWWHMLRERDPYNVEGHLQMLHYFSLRWHGTHGQMYDFASEAASIAPPGSALPVLLQYARVEQYRFITEREARGERCAPMGISLYWNNEGAAYDVERTWWRWMGARQVGRVPPGELRDLNYLAHAACCAGQRHIAGLIFRLLGRRVTRAPWCYTGDPEKQFVQWRRRLSQRGWGMGG